MYCAICRPIAIFSSVCDNTYNNGSSSSLCFLTRTKAHFNSFETNFRQKKKIIKSIPLNFDFLVAEYLNRRCK